MKNSNPLFRSVLVMIFALGSTGLLQGCATNRAATQLDRKLSDETTVHDPEDLRIESKQVIEASQQLTPEQRTQLLAIRNDLSTKSRESREQSFKLRSLLIKDLVSQKYDDAEVDLIKKRINELEQNRLSNLFEAVAKAQVIMGREPNGHKKIVSALLFEHLGPHREFGDDTEPQK